ncbi:hypothetical protein TI83_09095 [Rathayibacter toxicus]|nr:hypothetical protein TI83_09095 [Rathayibacter toxicus]
MRPRRRAEWSRSSSGRVGRAGARQCRARKTRRTASRRRTRRSARRNRPVRPSLALRGTPRPGSRGRPGTATLLESMRSRLRDTAAHPCPAGCPKTGGPHARSPQPLPARCHL